MRCSHMPRSSLLVGQRLPDLQLLSSLVLSYFGSNWFTLNNFNHYHLWLLLSASPIVVRNPFAFMLVYACSCVVLAYNPHLTFAFCSVALDILNADDIIINRLSHVVSLKRGRYKTSPLHLEWQPVSCWSCCGCCLLVSTRVALLSTWI